MRNSISFFRSLITHNLIAFLLLFSVIYFLGYTYITHLLLELSSIFISFIIFIVLIALPSAERTPFFQVIGTIFLSSGILDIPHAIFYPGFPGVSNPSLSVTYWMFARFIQSLGMFLAIFHLKYKNMDKKFELLTFLFPLFSIFIIFIIKYFPKDVFYIESLGTTNLKSILEIVYTLLFFIFGIKSKNNPYLFLGGIMFALSEISFIRYISPFTWSLWLGHIFKTLGIFNIAFYILTNYIYNPLMDYKALNEKYKIEGERLNETILKIIETQNKVLEVLNKALNCKDRDGLIKVIVDFFEKEGVRISLFYKKKHIYSSFSHVSDTIEDYDSKEYSKIERNDIIVFLENKDEIISKIYKLFILSLFSIFENINYINMLEKIEKERKEFIKNVSHEFRNPLFVVLGQAQLLKKAFYNSPEKIKDIAEQIEISSKRISDLVDKLLKVGEEDGKDSHR